MFFLSWLTARRSGTASVCLITLTDSPARQFFCEAAVIKGRGVIFVSCVCLLWRLPVRMDWSTRRVVDLMEMILMSAGTLSPTSVHTDRDALRYSCRLVPLTGPRRPECGATTGRLRD